MEVLEPKRKTEKKPHQYWQKVGEAFDKAVLLPKDERNSLLAGFAPDVRREVEKLLNHFETDSVEGFLETPAILQDEFLKGAPTLDDIKAGDKVGDFLLDKELGKGSFGRVFLAKQISLSREVALKITPDLGQEAQTMASMEHEGIVRVFSETIDPESGFRLLCMQYVPGVSLERIVESLKAEPLKANSARELLNRIRELAPTQGRFSPSEIQTAEQLRDYDYTQFVIWLGVRLSQALARSHTLGILHLDVKPANVIVNSLGLPYLTDFNVAIRSAEEKTKARLVGGTWEYMSPEHQDFLIHSRGKVDERADIFSLATLLKELLVLAPASDEGNANLRIPYENELTKFLEDCTSGILERRVETTSEMAERLESFLEKRQIARTFPPHPKLFRFGEKFPFLYVFLSVLAAHLVLTFVNVIHNQVRIVNELNAVQQQWFERLVLFYNPTVYPICMFFSVRIIWSFISVLRRDSEYYSKSAGERANLRTGLLRLATPVAIIAASGWLPGTLFFSGALHIICGPISLSVFSHFFIANFLCCLTGIAYSFIFIVPFLVRVIYPLALVGEIRVKEKSFDEIQKPLSSLFVFYRLSILLPVFSIVLIMVFGVTAKQTPEGLVHLRILITTLAVIAAIGFFLSFKGLELCERAFYVLSGKSLRRS